MAQYIPVALQSGTTDPQEARTFLEARIGRWAMWVCLLSSGFYLLNVILSVLVGGVYGSPADDWAGILLHPAPLMHAAASLFMGAVWQVTRLRPMSLEALGVLDLVTLLTACTCYALMGYFIADLQVAAGVHAELGLFPGLLAATSTVTSRAIIVPSTARRTAVASAAAFMPLVIATLIALRAASDPERVISVVAWCVLSTILATVGSQVIFGLRREAAQVRKLGQYTLLEKIGSGGMGSVYRASHAMLRRPTAVKLLLPDRAGEANLARFEREVQLTAALTHPNTIAIYDYGRTPDGLFYYAMEFLDGINLESLIRQYGPQEPGRVMRILGQVCGALVEAHEIGLIHRDIKPANIILTERGGEPDVAKLLDFGLVKQLPAKLVDTDAPTVTVDAGNVVMGTPAYMSPEAIVTPDRIDGRSDLYALGAVGYFLLTGRPMFEGKSAVGIMAQHLHEKPVPPSELSESPIPADLERVIMKCLEKRPEDRPHDARTLLRDLRAGAVTPAWSVEQAGDWWRRFRETSRLRPEAPPTLEGVTVKVDVAERLA